MRNPALAAQWFSNNGLSDVSDLPGDQGGIFVYSDKTHDVADVRLVSAYWPTSENGRLFRSVLSALVERVFSLGIRLNAVFDKEGNVLQIRIGSNPRFPK